MDEADRQYPCDCEAKHAFQTNLDALIERHCREWTVTTGSLTGALLMKGLSLWHECQHIECHDADPTITPIPPLENP